MPAALIGRILDYGVLVSDKSAYRSPTRGLQGNAWKTIIGIPYALGVTAPVVIEACGARHEIAGSLDPARNVVIRHDQAPSARTAGTSVTVPLPGTLAVDARGWAANFAVVNPHAHLIYRADGDEPGGTVSYKAQVSESWRKPTPSDPLVPAWYDLDAFRKLVFSHIGAARAGGRDIPVGEFIRSFAGLSGSAKAKQVKEALPGIETLSDFESDPDEAGTLLYAMQSASRPPQPAALGHVPEERYRTWLEALYDARRVWFRRARLEDAAGMPWVIEAAVAETAGEGDLTYAVNYSPSFGDPLGAAELIAGEVRATGAASFLWRCDAFPADDNHWRRAAVIHVITPAAEFTDKGKVRLEIPAEVADGFAACLAQVTAPLRREARQREKDARATDRRIAARNRAVTARQRALEAAEAPPREPTLIEAVAATIEAALEAQRGGTTLPFSARSLFYKIRPLVQEITGAELTDIYFTQQLLPAWQLEHGVIEGLYYEPRGTLYHPHDHGGDRDVQLGTREVQQYVPPGWTYDKLLVVAKAGLWPLLRESRIADRYDMAVITSEGFSSTGCRSLLASLPPGEVRIFSLHDADPAGYNLSAILGEETRRMPGHHVEVTDLGLTVGDAIRLGIPPEEFTRTKALPARILPGLTEAEREWFEGTVTGRTAKGKPQYGCKRTELNAFSSPGLIAYVEDGLALHGAAGKVVPPRGVLQREAREDLDALVARRVEEIIARLADTGSIVRDVRRIARRRTRQRLSPGAVRARLGERPERSWRQVAAEAATRQLSGSQVDFSRLVKQALIDQLLTEQGTGGTA